MCLVCPQRNGTDLREDIKTLIKFWQAIFQDKKWLLTILNIESKQRSVSMSSDIAIYSVSLIVNLSLPVGNMTFNYTPVLYILHTVDCVGNE